ncbi:MAG: helix-turn-helix domain-containing protein [Pseudomonadota bacterium]
MRDLPGESSGDCQETSKINTLLGINKALNSSLDLKATLNNMMNILASRLAMNRGSLALFDFETNELITEVVYGTYKPGAEEGDIHKKVFEGGVPIVIPASHSPPLFFDGSKTLDIRKPDIACLCAPMKVGGTVLGVLTVDRLFDDNVACDQDLRLLEGIASIMAQTVKTYQMVRKEREDLISENTRLCKELEKEKKLTTRDEDTLKTKSSKHLSIEKVLEKKLDEIITVMDVKTEGKRRLYADIVSKVEKTLIKLALKRTNNVKYEAARFLGINRNTLHKKINDLSISD